MAEQLAGFQFAKPFDVTNPVSTDKRYGKFNGNTTVPFVSIAEAVDLIKAPLRFQGLQCVIANGPSIDLYWWKDGLSDNQLVLLQPDIDSTKNLIAKQHISTSPGTIPAPVGVGGNTAFQDANFVAHLPPESYKAGKYPGYAFWTDDLDAATLYFRPTQEGADYGLWLLNIQGRHNQLAFTSDIPKPLFAGKFTTLSALQAAPGYDGAYAYLDAGKGTDAVEYIWDATDNKWTPSSNTGASSFGQLAGIPNDNPALATALGSKVNAVPNKGLSTEDYTSAEKNKLAAISREFSIAFTAPITKFDCDYFSQAVTIKSVITRKAASFSYSVDKGASYVTPTLPLTPQTYISLPSGTEVIWRIAYAANQTSASITIILQ